MGFYASIAQVTFSVIDITLSEALGPKALPFWLASI